MTGLIAHSAVPGLMYARTDVGGAYRRDARDEPWQPITDWIGQRDWRYTGIESMAVDPRDADRIYLAAGIYNREDLGPGAICRSFDRGRSFEVVEMPFGMGGNEAGRGGGERLVVDPNAGHVLWFGSRDAGLWRSNDAGASWFSVESFPEIDTALPTESGRSDYLSQAVGMIWVIVDPTCVQRGVSTTIYAAVSTVGPCVFRSQDAGASWRALPNQPTGLRPIRAVLASDGILYITYGREPGPNTMYDGAVWRFDTRTDVWTNITPLRPDPDAAQPFGYAGLAVDARHPETVMVTTAFRDHAAGSGGDEVFRSTDGGKSWRGVGQSGVRDSTAAPWLNFGAASAHVGHWMYALVIDPFDSSHALYATGQTIWASNDIGLGDASAGGAGTPCHWRVAARGIEETVPLAVASPSTGCELVVGTGDISGFTVLDVDAGESKIQLRDPTFKDTTSIDFAERRPQLVVRVGSRGWNRQRDRDTGAFSEDGGKTWRAFISYPEPGRDQGQIAVSVDGDVWLWAPRSGRSWGGGFLEPRVWLTDDGSQSWRPCEGLAEARHVVFADRVDAALFYAIELRDRHKDDETEPGLGRVLVSRDAGASFAATGATLPRVHQVDAVAVPGQRGHLWLAAQGNLWVSDDAGATFNQLSNLTAVTHVGIGRGSEPANQSSVYPTVYCVGELAHGGGAVAGFFRSLDRGASWACINDAEHQFGQIRLIAGDPKVFGRVYIGTGGRGLLVGEPQSVG